MQGKAGLWFRRASGVCLLLGAWQLASLFFPPLVVPPIAQVLSTLFRLMTQSDFGATIGTTILRLIAGLAIGVGVGAVLGLLFGLCPKIEDVGTPLIHVLQAIPPYAGWFWHWCGLDLTESLASSSWPQPQFQLW